MNKKSYLSNSSVQEFVNWITFYLDESNSFNHQYEILKTKKSWKCNSIHNAFVEYEWKFNSFDPNSKKKISGKSFEDSLNYLGKLSDGLRNSIELKHESICKDHCLAILKWGGVLNHNKNKIEDLYFKSELITYLSNIMVELHHDKYDMSIDYNYDEILMNAGFTKIYSLLIDDFIIYDGRVGAALGYFVRKFCEAKKLKYIPENLLFAYGDSRPTKFDTGLNRRNPSSDLYKFPKLDNKSKKHTENNMKANWIMKEILQNSNSKFLNLDEKIQLRALESAFFMIGYNVKNNE